MRAFLYAEKDVQCETLASVDEVVNTYHSVSTWEHWDQKRRNSYLLRNLKSSCFRHTIGSNLREFAVRHHACRLTTAEIISLVLGASEGERLMPQRYYTDYSPTMRQTCRDCLSTQLNDLKRGQARFPQTYNDLWQTARAEPLQEIQHLPLTPVTDPVEAMHQHYQKLTNAMTKTMSGIYMLTRDSAYPKPQTRPLEWTNGRQC